jgi:hypothetical protein
MNAERLLKLAEHLESGKLGHKEFSFACFGGRTKCGTAGCAIGECPFVWPESWKHIGILHPVPVLINGETTNPLDCAQEFFGLSFRQAIHLFIPEDQNAHIYGGEFLGADATPRQVASNIRAFVAKKQEAE